MMEAKEGNWPVLNQGWRKFTKKWIRTKSGVKLLTKEKESTKEDLTMILKALTVK